MLCAAKKFVKNDKLHKALNSPQLVFYGLGMILGAGIYSIIGAAAGKTGDNLWLSFACASLAALLTGLSYAELATTFPKVGAEFIYVKNGFPKIPAVSTAIGFMMVIAGAATAATVTVAFCDYLKFFLDFNAAIVSVILLAVLTAINIFGIRESSLFNIIFTSVEILGLVLFVWIGFDAKAFGEALVLMPTSATLSATALVIFAYFGFENIVNLVEESKIPSRDIPRAILISLFVATVFYILVSLSAVSLMDPKELSESKFPLVAAATNVNATVARVLGGMALFATTNTAFIALVSTSRLVLGIARGRGLPNALTILNKRKAPWVAALFVFIFAAGLIRLGQVETLASVSSLSTLIAFGAVQITVIKLRFTKPGLARPFRVPLTIGRLPILPSLGLATILILLFQFEEKIYLIAGILFILMAGVSKIWYRRTNEKRI